MSSPQAPFADRDADERQIADSQLADSQRPDSQRPDRQLADPQLADPQLADRRLGGPELDDPELDDPEPEDSELAEALSASRLAGVIGDLAGVDDAALKAWIARVVAQDEAALADLYRTLIGRVYGLALRIVRNAATAEEVAEDTFWQVWRQAPRFDPARGSALAWILIIARSRALDAVRARRRAMADTVSADALGSGLDDALWEIELREHGERDGEAAGLGADPLDLLGALQESRQLRLCLERLEPAARQLVALAFFRGLTHHEIVEHTGMPLGTVKSHIRRALRALRDWIEPAGHQRAPAVDGLLQSSGGKHDTPARPV